MNVLHLADVDNAGGSGRSAYRIHSGLRRLGVTSRMLVARKRSNDDQVRVINQNHRWYRLADRAARSIATFLSLQHLVVPSSRRLRHDPWVKETDIIQVFNCWGGFFSYRALPALSRLAPVVWRLSDQWLFTGHCNYSYDCERWKIGCGRCPYVKEEEALTFDTTRLLWSIKQRTLRNATLHVVAPSTWILSLARQSPLLQGKPITYIPNGVDGSVFYPRDKIDARKTLGLRPDSIIILFGSYSLGSKRKGGRQLIEALHRIDTGQVELVCFGNPSASLPVANVPVHFTGYIENDRVLAAMYSLADVYVLPTLADNLPNSVLEAMACGCPVVSFRVGGLPDAIAHMENGYLAEAGNALDLADGIQRIIQDESLREQMSRRSVETVRRKFSQENEARAFLSLYQSILSQPS